MQLLGKPVARGAAMKINAMRSRDHRRLSTRLVGVLLGRGGQQCPASKSAVRPRPGLWRRSGRGTTKAYRCASGRSRSTWRRPVQLTKSRGGQALQVRTLCPAHCPAPTSHTPASSSASYVDTDYTLQSAQYIRGYAYGAKAVPSSQSTATAKKTGKLLILLIHLIL